MARVQSAAYRGLGAHHVADKRRLLAALKDGEPCWRCGQPMYRSQALERDHVIDRALGGTNGPAVLSHAACNRSAGARLGNQMRQFKPASADSDIRCKTCGRTYHYTARACEMCGAHYHPSYGEQRTCGRACGVELRRRTYGHAGGAPRRPKPSPIPHVTYVLDCQQCGTQFTARQSNAMYCSLKCRNAKRFPSLRYCECGQQLLPGRHKCDDCKKAKKAAENREYWKRRRARAADDIMATSRCW